MKKSLSALIIFAATALFSSACSEEDGIVIVDLCTPSRASDPFDGGHYLRIISTGDVSSSVTFDLGSTNSLERGSVYPMGAYISITVDILNEGDIPISRGQTESVKVSPETRVCACLTRLQETELTYCDGRGCVFDTNQHRCVFYNLP